jgi:PAS domain S-box-containing protein
MRVVSDVLPGVEPSADVLEPTTSLRGWARLAGAAVTLIGGLTLIGWVLDVPRLTNVWPELPTMKVNTALAFVLSGLAVFRIRDPLTRTDLALLRLAASVLAVGGLATLWQYVTGADLGIDQWLVRDTAGAPGSPFPGRMSPITAMNFVLLGAGLGLLTRPRAARAAQSLILAVGAIGLVTLIGYLYGVSALVGEFNVYSTIALHTTVAFLVLSAGLLLASGHRGLMATISRPDGGGFVARRLLPAAVLVPVLAGSLPLLGRRTGAYGMEFGLALVAMTSVMALTALTWWSASALTRLEGQRRRADVLEALTSSAEDLAGSLQTETVLKAIAEHVRALTRSDFSFLAVRDHTTGDYVITMTSGTETSLVAGYVAARGAGLGRTTVETGELAWSADYPNDPRRDPGFLEIAAAERLVSVAVAPIRIEGRLEGLLYAATRRSRTYGLEDRAAMTRLANQAAIALRNATLFESVEAARRDAERARADLAESQQRLQTLLHSAPDGIVTIDAAGRIVLVNARVETLFGHSREDLLGAPLEILLPEASREAHRHHRAGYAAAPRTRPMGAGLALVGRRKDGTEFPIEVSLSPLQTREGLLVTSIIRDVSQRQEIEERLRRSQKMEAIGLLAGGIAHDFNNLLQVIQGRGELLLRHVPPDDFAHRLGSVIVETAGRAASLVQQLLAFSRRQVLAPTILDLGAIIAGMHEMLLRLIREDIHLVVRVSPDLDAVRMDRSQLEQVVLNLAVNACDAMSSGGTLTIEATNVVLDDAMARRYPGIGPGRFVAVAVTDTGVGMDAETKRRIFDPFFTTKEQGRGTGLGLAVVYGVVRQAGGVIDVDSAVGRGTTVRIYLPAADRPAESAAPAAQAPSLPPRGSEIVVLVEDNDAVRALAQEILETLGYTVLAAASPSEARALCEAREGPIDLLLTDVVMPEMSGRQLAEIVRRGHPETRILYMSGYADNVVVHRGILDAGTHLVQKPFTLEALADKVREVLDGPAPATTDGAS